MSRETTPDQHIAAWDAEVTFAVRVVVHDPDVIERVTGPDGDEWRSQFYNLRGDSDVIEHLAYNFVHNGVDDITRLDGWADCKPDAVTFETHHTYLEATEPAA